MLAVTIVEIRSIKVGRTETTKSQTNLINSSNSKNNFCRIIINYSK
jgi:hypothetical protein